MSKIGSVITWVKSRARPARDAVVYSERLGWGVQSLGLFSTLSGDVLIRYERGSYDSRTQRSEPYPTRSTASPTRAGVFEAIDGAGRAGIPQRGRRSAKKKLIGGRLRLEQVL